MTEIKIAVIGAGNIGLRHLQSILKMEKPTIVQVVDPSTNALQRAKVFVGQLPNNNWIHRIEYINSLVELFDEIDCAVVATTADVRRTVIEQLIKLKRVKYLILEKVLFQRIQDYFDVKTLLDTYGVRAWVNCGRRVWPSYQRIKKELTPACQVECSVSGSQWGLACNSIHFVDLLAYLTNDTEIGKFINQLHSHIQPSKRAGFVEFYGTMQCSTKQGHRLVMTSYSEGVAPHLIQIQSQHVRLIIRETEGKMWRSGESTGWKWVEEDFPIVYQSQLTHQIIEELINAGDCGLTSFEESLQLHIPLISFFLSHYSMVMKKDVDICPIT